MLTCTCIYIENCISYNNNDSIKNVNKRLILSAIKITYMSICVWCAGHSYIEIQS